MWKNDLVELIQNTITKFCHDFLLRPYLCYTEHGMHALFFQQLYNVLPKPIVHFEGEDVCILQKEYPTANKLGKSRRQHWDIALIKTPIEMPQRRPRFDYLRLAAVIEFGLNCDSKRLEDDIERLCHPDANVDNGFIVHLYRLSSSKAKFSDWDWSPDSGILCSKELIQVVLSQREPPITVYYGIVDMTNKYPRGLWGISSQNIMPLSLPFRPA